MGAARQLCPVIDTAITQECMESKRVAEEWAKIRDEEERRLYEMVVSNARSEGLKSGLRQGKKEGIRQGKKQGIRQGKKEGKREGINANKVQVVTQMHKMNFKVEVISEIVDMPKSEVIAIIKGK